MTNDVKSAVQPLRDIAPTPAPPPWDERARDIDLLCSYVETSEGGGTQRFKRPELRAAIARLRGKS